MIRFQRDDQGFTLIEMAIVTIIIGILMTVMMNAYQTYDLQRRLDITRDNIQAVREALTDYQDTTGAYPLPARRNLESGDSGYGEAAVLDANGTPVLGTCVNGDDIDVGLCRVSGRDADGDGVGDDVLIGIVPFNTIIPNLTNAKLARANVVDGWGRALTFAVSRGLTEPFNFSSNGGAISVQDEFGRDLTDPAGAAHFIIISHGDNGSGAFSPTGGRFSDCPIGVTERENCDVDAIFVSGLRIKGNNAEYNDDMVRYLAWSGSSIWNYAPDGENIYNTNIGNVGIGTDTPAERLHVVGVLRGRNALSSGFCTENGADCMKTAVIAGNEPACPTGQVATGIGLNKLICATVTGSVTNSTCAPGTKAVGYSTKTGLICE